MTDERSQVLLEFPSIRARLAEHTAFAPSRRLAEAMSWAAVRMLESVERATSGP
jgi:hypothetical protein